MTPGRRCGNSPPRCSSEHGRRRSRKAPESDLVRAINVGVSLAPAQPRPRARAAYQGEVGLGRPWSGPDGRPSGRCCRGRRVVGMLPDPRRLGFVELCFDHERWAREALAAFLASSIFDQPSFGEVTVTQVEESTVLDLRPADQVSQPSTRARRPARSGDRQHGVTSTTVPGPGPRRVLARGGLTGGSRGDARLALAAVPVG